MELTFEWLSDPNAWIALLTLTILEIVLGVDNIIFISILTGKLPPEQQNKARYWGLGLAMGMRILLLLAIGAVMALDKTPLVTIPESVVFWMDHPLAITWKDLILILGGLFLLGKSVHEIHGKLEGEEHETKGGKAATMGAVLFQIIMLDMVFSIDSVITAVGMAKQVTVMIIAVVIAVGFMMLFAKPVGDFVEKHPTVKVLALAFLILIGVSLVAHGTHHEIPKGYIYFAMAFSIVVEMINIKVRGSRKSKPVHLRSPYTDDTAESQTAKAD